MVTKGGKLEHFKDEGYTDCVRSLNKQALGLISIGWTKLGLPFTISRLNPMITIFLRNGINIVLSPKNTVRTINNISVRDYNLVPKGFISYAKRNGYKIYDNPPFSILKCCYNWCLSLDLDFLLYSCSLAGIKKYSRNGCIIPLGHMMFKGVGQDLPISLIGNWGKGIYYIPELSLYDKHPPYDLKPGFYGFITIFDQLVRSIKPYHLLESIDYNLSWKQDKAKGLGFFGGNFELLKPLVFNK